MIRRGLIFVFLVLVVGRAVTTPLPAWMDAELDARAAALGGITTVLPQDGFAGLHNPAGEIQQGSAVAAVQNGLESSSWVYLGLQGASASWNYGLSILQYGIYGIKQTTYTNGRPVWTGNDLSAYSRTLSLILSRKMTLLPGTDLETGAVLHVVNSRLGGSVGNGLGLDIGTRLKWGRLLCLALVYQNAVPLEVHWDTGTLETYSRQVRFGGRLDLTSQLRLFYEATNRNTDPRLGLGLEWAYAKLLFLRAGLSNESIHLGLGVMFAPLQLDVATILSRPDYDYMGPRLVVSGQLLF